MLSMIVAMDRNKGIGKDGGMPWHIKEELQLFKKNTLHHTILMGKTTYMGLPRKLVDRKIVVVTRNREYTVDDPDVSVIYDLKAFLEEYKESEEEVIICGGASIYKQAYPYVSKATVSLIQDEFDVDRKLDFFSMEDWNTVDQQVYEKFICYQLERK